MRLTRDDLDAWAERAARLNESEPKQRLPAESSDDDLYQQTLEELDDRAAFDLLYYARPYGHLLVWEFVHNQHVFTAAVRCSPAVSDPCRFVGSDGLGCCDGSCEARRG